MDRDICNGCEVTKCGRTDVSVACCHAQEGNDRYVSTILQKYKPLIHGKLTTVPAVDHDDFIAIYNMTMWHGTLMWKKNSSADTYLFSFAKSTVRQYLRSLQYSTSPNMEKPVYLYDVADELITEGDSYDTD